MTPNATLARIATRVEPFDKWAFYGFLAELRATGHRWTYADVSAASGIDVAVLKMRMRDLRKMAPR